jgi:predicted DNA-binding transcriptional regulator YafY
MRRADRLFQIVQHLRGRRLTTAAQLARWLEVSERTIYRDVRDLSLSGVPVEGEAGCGYRISRGFEVPPLMFTLDEVEAMAAGARIVEVWGGPSLARAGRSALEKITMALPPARRSEVEATRLFAPGFHLDPSVGARLDLIRQAISEKRKLRLGYEDAEGHLSQRTIRPLALHFWGATWTMAAWCESRHDFRNFRLDRCREAAVTEERFEEESGKTLADFLRKLESQESGSSRSRKRG